MMYMQGIADTASENTERGHCPSPSLYTQLSICTLVSLEFSLAHTGYVFPSMFLTRFPRERQWKWIMCLCSYSYWIRTRIPGTDGFYKIEQKSKTGAVHGGYRGSRKGIRKEWRRVSMMDIFCIFI
jgi:hypothetical protein